MTTIQNRSEYLFIYDVRDSNPNGDPLDENKPRVDEETGQVIVTDVRLKRTVRDYLFSEKKLDIFIREIRHDNDQLQTKEERSKTFDQDPHKILDSCIDLRLFGATTAVKNGSMILTGPVQFKFGRTLHRVHGPVLMQGTTVMPSTSGKKQGTFREEWILPYGLIAFYGIVNEQAAAETKLMESDLAHLTEALWNGTKSLITRSKVGQMPRLLMRLVYKENQHFHIGDLDRLVAWELPDDKRQEEVRDIAEGTLEVEYLLQTLKKHTDKLQRIELAVHDRLHCSTNVASWLTENLTGVEIKVLEALA